MEKNIDENIQQIIEEIKIGKCVLILGTDIIDFGPNSFFKTMFDALSNDPNYKDSIDKAPEYIFINEDLVQLLPTATSREYHVRKRMQQFYKEQKEFDNPLTKISRIPFHLIISLFPDDRLKNIFIEQNLDYEYSYYPIYPLETAPDPVPTPTSKKPLIYNLLGDFDNGVIITFDHLFSFLSGIMGGSRQLPDNIQKALQIARTFIFLGVHFEKWYIQLLLRIITSKSEKEKYTILKNGNSNDVCTFIARRFKLDLLSEEPSNFLDDLYNACKAQNILKGITKIFISYSHKDKAIVQRIITKLQEANIEVVVDDNNMRGGQKIDDFIASIKDVDIVICIISKNSLLSRWVIKEINTTIVKTKKYFLPCTLDEFFLDQNFVDTAHKNATDELQKIQDVIMKKGPKDDLSDLIKEKSEWLDYIATLYFVQNEIKNRKCLYIDDIEFDQKVAILINEINILIKK